MVGIERGALRNAIHPYLEDEQRRQGRWLNITDVTHGGKKKTDRITWSLQGRMEHGRIKLNSNGSSVWHKDFIGQLLDFPNKQTHDDLIDALAYIDQVSVADYMSSIEVEDWQPLDLVAGY